jgi:anti-sigma factor RsiW
MMDQHWTAEDVERFADGEATREEQHLRQCAPCANAVLAAVQMKSAVRDAMQVGPAPRSLRRRVTTRPAPPWWIAVAAVVAAIAISSAFLLRRHDDPTAELMDMHVTLLASANPVDVISTDRHTVKPWFEGRVPFAVPVPDLASTPFRLIGGRVVFWRGSPAAYLLIGKGAHRISLFVLRDGPALPATTPPGHSILEWQSNGLTFVAVADVPQSDLTLLRQAFGSG